MAKYSIFFGILLIVVGVVGYLMGGTPNGTRSVTALIPAFIGGILFLCGIIVIANANLRKHVMHVAALVSLIGLVGSAMRAIPQVPALAQGTAKLPLATGSQLVTAVLCLLFLILCIKSFIDARRAR